MSCCGLNNILIGKKREGKKEVDPREVLALMHVSHFQNIKIYKIQECRKMFCFLFLLMVCINISYGFIITKMTDTKVNNPGSRRRDPIYGNRSKFSIIRASSYEAQLNPQALEGLLGSVLFLVAAQQIWWNDVIPQKRTELAKSKANGEVKEFLDDIKNSDESEMQLEKWFFDDWLKKEKKSAAIPFIKKVKWNSGDNPVLVAFAGILSCVVAASLAERATMVIH